jgi:F420H(2)-dependent quinone reductase
MIMEWRAAQLRAMYPGGRGTPAARRMARCWAVVFAAGLQPRRWVTLEVAGRRSGRPTRFPLGMADWDGHWYLVSMLGERCNWVRNVRAANGQATLWRRRAMPCRLDEVPVAGRAPILRRYLAVVPGARPHIPVGRNAPVAEFAAVAGRYPVFQVTPQSGQPDAVARADQPGGVVRDGRPGVVAGGGAPGGVVRDGRPGVVAGGGAR